MKASCGGYPIQPVKRSGGGPRPPYQEMVHRTDLNFPINVQTIGPLFQVTPAQTRPNFVSIVGNLRRDKLCEPGGGGGLGVLHCTVNNEVSLGYLRENLNFLQIYSLRS